MGCCQSDHRSLNDFKSEIVGYEKQEEQSNIFEDNFYIDSVERYNVKYKPANKSQNDQSDPHSVNINGGSGASGGNNYKLGAKIK